MRKWRPTPSACSFLGQVGLVLDLWRGMAALPNLSSWLFQGLTVGPLSWVLHTSCDTGLELRVVDSSRPESLNYRYKSSRRGASVLGRDANTLRGYLCAGAGARLLSYLSPQHSRAWQRGL